MKYQMTLDGKKIPLNEIRIKDRLQYQAELINKATAENPDDDRSFLCPWVPQPTWDIFITRLKMDNGFSYNAFRERGMQYVFDLCEKFAHLITGFKYLKYKRFLLD